MLTFRRRLFLVRLLLREPMSSTRLIETMQAELGADGYPTAAASALKHDLDALKIEYGCRITFDRSTGRYIMEDLGKLALLDLPAPCMEALAFLEASFPSGMALAEHANIRELLARVVMTIPFEHRDVYRQHSAAFLHLTGKAPGRIDPVVNKTIRRAIKRRQEVAFLYWSTLDSKQPRYHRVAPYRIFRPEGQSDLLDATLLEVRPAGEETVHDTVHYRLEHIVPGSVELLPNALPTERIIPPVLTLRYRLAPRMARQQDVLPYFPGTQISYQDDGSALVTATITNLWQTHQVLLRYGAACEVLEPPELVALFRETAQEFAQVYGTAPGSADTALE